MILSRCFADVHRMSLVAGLIFASLFCSAATVSAQSAGKPLDPVSVRLSFFAAGYSAPFYVGASKGFYRDAGLDVTVSEGQGAAVVLPQIAAGYVTFGYGPADAVIRGVAQGMPLKMVASLGRDNGYCVMVKDGSPIKTAKDLEGKTYLSQAGGPGKALLPAFMKASNADITKVRQVTGDAANLMAGFIGDQVDAAASVSYDEIPRMDARGIKVRCMSYYDAGVKILGQGIITSLSTIQDKPDIVRRFVAATLQAYAYSFAHPEETAAIVKKMAGDSVANETVTVEQLKFYEKLQNKPLGYATESAWQESLSNLKEYHVVENPPADISRYFTNDFLPK